MTSDIYWIAHPGPFRLAIMARPRAGDWLADEVENWRRQGIERVVSLLEREEVAELGLEGEATLCRECGIAFASFPIADRATPEDWRAALALAREIAGGGKAVAIHCRIGIGRSSIIAAAALCTGGMEPEAALAAIRQARGVPVPDTEQQRDWILRLGERLDRSPPIA
jgi:protein-tyrosine phosphatase